MHRYHFIGVRFSATCSSKPLHPGTVNLNVRSGAFTMDIAFCHGSGRRGKRLRGRIFR